MEFFLPGDFMSPALYIGGSWKSAIPGVIALACKFTIVLFWVSYSFALAERFRNEM